MTRAVTSAHHKTSKLPLMQFLEEDYSHLMHQIDFGGVGSDLDY